MTIARNSEIEVAYSLRSGREYPHYARLLGSGMPGRWSVEERQRNDDLPERVYLEMVAFPFLNLEHLIFHPRSISPNRIALCSGSFMRVSQSPHPSNLLYSSTGLVLSSVKRSTGLSLPRKGLRLVLGPSNETDSKQLM